MIGEPPKKLPLRLLYEAAVKEIKKLRIVKGQLLSEVEHLTHENEKLQRERNKAIEKLERRGLNVEVWEKEICREDMYTRLQAKLRDCRNDLKKMTAARDRAYYLLNGSKKDSQ